jgi:hypothetical protein
MRSRRRREALRRRPRIRPRGVMEYWPARIATRSVAGGSVGVLRQFGIAPRVRGVGSAFRAHLLATTNPGLKPWAESYYPFGIRRTVASRQWSSLSQCCVPHATVLFLLDGTDRFL